MGRHSKEYNEGYEAFKEAWKKAQQQQNGGSGGSGGGQGADPGQLSLPDIDGTGSGKPGDKNKKGKGSGNMTDSDKTKSESGRGNGQQGTVHAEDMEGPSELSKCPGTAGGMIDRQTGDKIAKMEGEDENSPAQSAVEKDWGDAAKKAAQKASKEAGNAAGGVLAKINDIWRTTKDWKKELKKVVGMSLNPEDRRQAYANKNVLTSQDRIARTDKDKYDSSDFMMVFIDSSGSMSDDQLRMCLGEVYGVALAKKPIKLYVVQCDTKVQSIEEYSNIRELQKNIKNATVKGRGGTDLKPCFDLLKNDPRFKRRRCDLVMVFTDGHWDDRWVKRDRRQIDHLVWCILDNPNWSIPNKDANTKAVYLNTNDIR